jgi:hypothetical protein
MNDATASSCTRIIRHGGRLHSEMICDGEAQRCPICGKHGSVCTCLRREDDGTTTPRREIAHATLHELRWRHSHWWARRQKVLQAMTAAQVSWKKIERFTHCGACARVVFSATLNKRRITASYCHDRHCEPCMRAKANLLATNLEKKLAGKAAGRFRFITLTLLHTQAPLKQQLDRLIKCFRKLRSGKLWKTAVAGGAATIEVKLAETTAADAGHLWHPHLHIVVDSHWINQAELSAEWHRITGDSYIVDIQKLDDAHAAAFYVAKYISKGTNAAVWNNDTAALEWMKATKGVRTCLTFGSWRGMKLTEKPTDPGDWTDEGGLEELIVRATEGENHASIVLLTLRPPGATDAIPWQ